MHGLRTSHELRHSDSKITCPFTSGLNHVSSSSDFQLRLDVLLRDFSLGKSGALGEVSLSRGSRFTDFALRKCGSFPQGTLSRKSLGGDLPLSAGAVPSHPSNQYGCTEAAEGRGVIGA